MTHQPLDAEAALRCVYFEKVATTPEALLADPPGVLGGSPTIDLRLQDANERLPEVLKLDQLQRVIGLGLFSQNIGDAGVAAIAACRFLDRLLWLDLGYCDIGQEGLEHLCQAQSLPRLRFVNLAGNRVGDPCDEAWEDQGAVVGWGTSGGRTLEERFGPLPWLHWRGTPRPTTQEVLFALRLESS